MSENQPNPEAVPLAWEPVSDYGRHPSFAQFVAFVGPEIWRGYSVWDNGDWRFLYNGTMQHAESVDAAKAAAEAHYRQRLMSALEQVTP